MLAHINRIISHTTKFITLLTLRRHTSRRSAFALLTQGPHPIIKINHIQRILILARLISTHQRRILRTGALLAIIRRILSHILLDPQSSILRRHTKIRILRMRSLLIAINMNSLRRTILVKLQMRPLRHPLSRNNSYHVKIPAIFKRIIKVRERSKYRMLNRSINNNLHIKTFSLSLRIRTSKPRGNQISRILTITHPSRSSILRTLSTISLQRRLERSHILSVT